MIRPPRRHGWLVYMLRCRDGSLYTGITNDLARRLRVHETGRGARYTRSRLPVTLVYQEPQPNRSAALKREAAIKRLPRVAKQKLVGQRPRGAAARGRRQPRVQA
ncbi:MAG: GIY-YIG nuclease family protein [Planctomycetia bacterium]